MISTRTRTPIATFVALGALLGLAWASGLRGFMVQVTEVSVVGWAGTFGGILLPGMVTGALLGWAEYLRRTGGRPGWRWLAVAPLLLATVSFLDLPTLLTTGMGGGALGVSLIGMAGGYAISRRGRLWGRIVCGLVALVAIPGWALGAPAMGLAIDTPRGAWVALYFWSFLAVLALASAIPHRPVIEPARARAADATAAHLA